MISKASWRNHSANLVSLTPSHLDKVQGQLMEFIYTGVVVVFSAAPAGVPKGRRSDLHQHPKLCKLRGGSSWRIFSDSYYL